MGTNGARWRQFRLLVLLAVVSSLLIGLLEPGQVVAEGGTFPAQPFNGLQLTYDVSGAEWDAPVGQDGFTVSRTLKGRITGDRLVVSGTATARNGWGATIDVSVSAEGTQPKTYHGGKTDSEKGLAPNPMSESFSVALDVPRTASWAKFSISLVGTYNAGTRGVSISGTATRAVSSPTPKPVGQMLVRADPLLLPVDGTSNSPIVFTWLEGEQPVAGRTVDFALQGAGTLDAQSGVTDANGNVTVTLTAPPAGAQAGDKATVAGRGQDGPEAQIEIAYGSVGVEFVDLHAKADRGGDQLLLRAVIRSYHNAALADVPVEFYDGNPASGGKLLGKQTLANLPPNSRVRSATQVNDYVAWDIGLKAEKKKLYVRIPEIAGFDAKGKTPLAERAFTVSNQGTTFKTSVDGYSFENPGVDDTQAMALEDALIGFLSGRRGRHEAVAVHVDVGPRFAAQVEPVHPEARTAEPVARPEADAPEADGEVFCDQCGARLRSGVRFCRKCGASLE